MEFVGSMTRKRKDKRIQGHLGNEDYIVIKDEQCNYRDFSN